jgi:hypothetical protein
MKAHLMFRDGDLDLERPLPPNTEALEQDLELNTLFDAMARGDAYLRELAEKALLSGLTDPEAILYRQQIVADCLAQPLVVRELYDIAVEGVESKRQARFFWFRDSPEAVLQKALGMLDLLVEVLKRLRKLADEHAAAFQSDGFTRLFATLERELDDDYLRTINDYMRELRFPRATDQR